MVEAHPHPPPYDITPELSADIVLFQILPRLPVKSVLRFRCVSKQWHSFLTTPSFVKMHLHHYNILTNNKMVVVSCKTRNTFCTIYCERPNDGFTDGRNFSFKIGPLQCIRILTSVHGLLCIGIEKQNELIYGEYSDLILWNPATGDYKTLSKPLTISHQEDCYRMDESRFGLYHSSCDDDYKLLRVTRDPNNVYIYSLKSDSWRKVESGFQRTKRRMLYWLLYKWGPSVSLNENLYFLERARNEPYSVMRFNTKTETLKVIATPFSRDGRTTWLSFTADKRDGCIELWVNTENSTENELWRMDGDGDWTKVGNLGTILSNISIQYPDRLHLMRSGHLLMYDSWAGSIYQLDIMKTHTRNMCLNVERLMDVSQGGKYTETMVSPNQYVN